MSEKTPTAKIDTPKRSTFVEPVAEEEDANVAKLPEFLREDPETTPTIAERKAQEETKQSDMNTIGGVSVPIRSSVIAQAATLISGEREDEYGAPQQSFGNIADIWTVILGRRVTEKQVALMMAGLKIARLSYDPDARDGWVDLVGYAALGAEVQETDLFRQTREEL